MADNLGFGPSIEPVQPMSPAVEVRNALHWLVRMSSSFCDSIDARDGYGLRWHAERCTVLSPELIKGVRLELSVPTLSFQFHENGKPSPHVFETNEKSSAEIEAWLLVEMLHRDFERERFSKTLPYVASPLMGGDEPKYETAEHEAELAAIADSLVSATRTLEAARKALDVAAVSDPLVVWPEPLSVGFLTAASDGAASKPVVRLAYALDADGVGRSAFVAARYSDGGDFSNSRLLDNADGDQSVDAIVALIRDVEKAARQ